MGMWWPRRARIPSVGVLLGVWLPVMCFVVLAWNRRWMSDDGYINLRIVHNVLHGHGPVFNVGERAEAATSPAWIAVLSLARIPLWFMDPAWVAVLVGIALASLGIALAVLGARRWWSSLGRQASIPLGVLVLIALPAMWDFASSGFETGLCFAWLGGCWWVTVRRLDGEPPALHRPFWAPVLIGLGPLVRPDFAIFTLVFAISYTVASQRTRRGAVLGLAAGLALPVGYQIFRMGYFGMLVPNTALAKEAGRALWGRGRLYVDAYLDITLLLVPLVVIAAVVLIFAWRSRPSLRHTIVALAPVLGGLLHALYVMRVGGDFIFARLLLPATFTVLLPGAAVPMPPRRFLQGALLAAAGAWVIFSSAQPPYEPRTQVEAFYFGDLRAAFVERTGNPDPVTLDDFAVVGGSFWSREAVPGQMVAVLSGRAVPADRPIIVSGVVGMVSVRLWGTHVADDFALAEPIGSHMAAGPPGRAGHEKRMEWFWLEARFGTGEDPAADVAAARRALACGKLAELVEAVDDPMTPGRFVNNLLGAVHRTSLRIPVNPFEAERRFC